MLLWIVGCALEAVLGLSILVFFLIDRQKAKKKIRKEERSLSSKTKIVQDDEYDYACWLLNLKEGKALIVPFGRHLLSLWESARLRNGTSGNTKAASSAAPVRENGKQQRRKTHLKRRRFAGGIRKMLVDTMGEEEGAREYRFYRMEQLGTGAVTFFLMGLILLFATMPGMDHATLDHAIERPQFGKGDRKENVSFTIQAEEDSFSGSILITIPEKKITEEEAGEKIKDLLSRIGAAYNGTVFTKDLSFPSTVDKVLLQVKSLSQGVVRSDGRFLVYPGKERQEIRFLVTASLGGMEESRVITAYLASYEELSLEEKAAWLKKKLQQGAYVDEEALVLPEETQDGEKLIWTKNSGSSLLFFLLLLVIVPVLVFLKQENDLKRTMKGRTQRIRQSFPLFAGEVGILVGAGCSLRNAFKRLSLDYEKQRKGSMRRDPLMEEVRKVSLEMEEGASMREALEHFSDRIHLRDVRRFVSLLNQNLRRGDENLLIRLNELTEEVWEKRKKEVREKTEEADTKLLIPLMMMLAVILMIVLAPCMMTIGI